MQKNIIYKATICLFLLALSMTTQAQSYGGSDHKGYGHAYAGGFGNEYSGGGFTAGGGGEALIYKGVSLGGDFTFFSPKLDWGRSYGAAAFNGGYHFASSDGKVVPFVTGGPMAFFGDGVGYGFHAGGGANYWFKERLGARFEFRTHVPVNTDLRPFYSFRAGITFR